VRENHRVIDPLQTVLIVASLLLTAATLVYVVLDRPPDNALVGGAAVVELGLMVQAAVGVVQAVGGRDIDTISFVGYLLATLIVLPAGVLWSLGERSRGGTAVLAVAGFTTAFLVLRLLQIWGA
jgi:hypothetical protein